MWSTFLRSFRIFFSAFVVICFIVVFSDFKYIIPSKYINFLLWFQFVPSAVKFYDLLTLAAAGLAGVRVLTLITGRSYCSFLCPLGIAHDINSMIGGRIRRKFRRYGFKKPFTILRYIILALVLVVTFFSGIYLLNLLDPYAVFGRSVTMFIKPLVVVMNNFIVWILGKFDNYSLSHITVSGYRLVA